MSFTQRYKKDIMDLLHKSALKRKNINEKSNQTDNTHIVNLKHSDLLNNNLSKNKPIYLNNSFYPLKNEFPSVSIFNNKKINRATSMNKVYNKKYIPMFKINYRKIRKNNCFSDTKRFSNYYNKTKILNIDDEIVKDIDKNIKFLLVKNDAKYKLINKLERINFYNRIKKAHDEINIINKKKLYFNKSLFLFTPFKGIYQRMNNKNS